MQDSEIIALYWARNEDAIPATETAYGSYCRTISANILPNSEDVEECVADTWFSAWNAIPPARPARLSAFLGRITRNLSLDRWRRNNAEKRGAGTVSAALFELENCLSAADSVEQTLQLQELAESIERFLYKQQELKRSIFLRRYWYLCSIEEISRDFSISKSKIASLLFRMRNQLKHHLEKEGISI